MKKIFVFSLFFILSCSKEVQKNEKKTLENNSKISKKNTNFTSLNSDNLENLTAISNPNAIYIVTDGKHVELCYKEGDAYKVVQQEGDTSTPKIFIPTKVLGSSDFIGPLPKPHRPPTK